MSKRNISKQDDREKINVRERLTDNVLDLSLMNISEVPVNDIKPLKRATVLDLSNNVITAINSDFSTLIQLTKLDLSNNKIKSISDDFGNLINLRHLDLYNNQIERLPLSFGRLQKLKYLDLKNNRLNPVFSKIIGTCTDQKDCMEAARKAVAFMVDIEQQVLEDRRRKKEQKDMEMQRVQDKDSQESKQTEKSNIDKKKKNKNKKPKSQPTQEDQKEKHIIAKSSITTETENHLQRKESSTGITRYVVIPFAIIIILFLLICFLRTDLIYDLFGNNYSEIMEEYIK